MPIGVSVSRPVGTVNPTIKSTQVSSVWLYSTTQTKVAATQIGINFKYQWPLLKFPKRKFKVPLFLYLKLSCRTSLLKLNKLVYVLLAKLLVILFSHSLFSIADFDFLYINV